MSNTPQINIGAVTGGQNNIGQNTIQGNQIHLSQTKPDDTELLQSVLRTIESEMRRRDPNWTNANWDEVERLANLPGSVETPESRTRHADSGDNSDDPALIESLIQAIKPYSREILRSLACFGSGALESLAKGNPLINGILSVCKDQMSRDPDQM